jgi:hypothetical protein
MLTNPTVAGHRVYRGRIVGRGVWEPILDEDTWQAVRAKLARPRTVRKGNGGTYDITGHQYGSHSARSRRRYLLTGGVAVCGVCGAPMKAQRRKVYGERLDAIYVCSSRYCVGVMADPLEDHVRDRLLDELDKPEFLEQVAAGNHTDHRDEISNALQAIDGQRRTLAELWSGGELTDSEWRAARQTLAEREQELRRELAMLPPPITAVDISQIRDAWPAMTLDERREIITMFIARVIVARAKPGTRAFDPGRVAVGWRRL